MEQERKHNPEEAAPAGEKAIRRFRERVAQFAEGGNFNKETGTKWNGYQLSPGKTARVIETGIVEADLDPTEPTAQLIVYEQNGSEHTWTRFRLFADGRVEKDVRGESGYEIARQWQGGPVRMDEEGNPVLPEWRKEEMRKEQEAEKTERDMGLRVASEADMHEAEAVFAEIQNKIEDPADTGHLRREKLEETKKMTDEAKQAGYENIEDMFKDRE